MEQEQILKGNKLIAEFMNFETSDAEIYTDYSISWNWLMPVVEKIRKIQLPKPSMIPISVVINNYGCVISDGCWFSTEIVSCTKTKNTDSLKLTYQAVVKFIEWYNKNK